MSCDGPTCHEHDGEMSHDLDCSVLTDEQRAFLRGHTIEELIALTLTNESARPTG